MLAPFTGTVYPDKTFSIGYVSKKKKRKDDREYDREYQRQPETDYWAVSDWLQGITDIQGKFCSTSEAPLLVKSGESSQKSKAKYGRHGITAFGKKFVVNACILLQKKYGRRRLGFATATIPAVDVSICRAINGRLSEITRRFYQGIKRICERRGSEFIYVGCVEIQEKRFEDTGYPVPHLHFVYVSKDSLRSGYLFTTVEVYRLWNRSVNHVLRRAGLPEIMGNNGHVGSVKLEAVRTSASAYLGKYVSKGVTVINCMIERGYEEFPKQWWTASENVKALYKDSLVRMNANTAQAIFMGLENFLHEGYIVWGRFVEIEWNGTFRKIGAHGTLSDSFYEILVSSE